MKSISSYGMIAEVHSGKIMVKEQGDVEYVQ